MWKFIKSAASEKDWLKHESIEICFIGRSNVGKSSIINALAMNKKLAKTSKTPGRTQLINYFQTDKDLIVVDLPGYGFANISLEKQEKMFSMVDEYFLKSKPKYVFLLLDARRGIMEQDQNIINHLRSIGHNLIFIITKIDKANQKEIFSITSNEIIKNSMFFLSALNNEKKISMIRDFINKII